MNKKIWLTGALSIAVIIITVFIYNNFITDKDAVAEKQAAAEAEQAESLSYREPGEADYISLTEGRSGILEYSNDVFSAEFTESGALLTSLKLNKYLDGRGNPVNLIFSGDSGMSAFTLHDGDFNGKVITGPYEGRINDDKVVFTALLEDGNGNKFRIVKTWEFADGSYMLGFRIELISVEGEIPLGSNGYLYSLGIGPQLGPPVEKMNRGYVYRYFCLLDNGEKRNVGTPEDSLTLSLDTPYRWLGMEGRYFAYATIPQLDDYDPAWDERHAEGLFKRNEYYIQRPHAAGAGGAGSFVSDQYYMYFGPKDRAVLESFDSSDTNVFGLSELNLGLLAGDGGIVYALSNIVKNVLNVLNKVVPNYGLDIILFALIIQLLIFPISRRTYDNAIRMQLLGPGIGELKKKYKYNDQKMNEETMKLFEDNNVKPRSSMVPFVIHLPFFILTYVLLLTNIDFRLASFIPGWINDISLPEYILDFSPGVMPITGWDKIRILPVIALAVSLVQSRYIQAPADSIRSMRIMSYLIPVVMFLVIYNMPSGAVLYWLAMTSTNLLIQWRIKARYENKK